MTEYQVNLASSHNNLGLLLAGLGKRPQADEQLRNGLALREKLTANFPDVPEHRVELGASYFSLGLLNLENGKPAESLEWFGKAIATLRTIHAAEPHDVTA